MDPLQFTPDAFELNRLLRRDCVQCDDSTPLTCPTCPSGQVCIQISPTCDQCASRKCVPSAVSGANPKSPVHQSSGPSIGAIVGGVIGGIAFIAILTFCLWWFVIRKRRQQWEDAYVEDYDELEEEEKRNRRSTFNAVPRPRSDNTRSVASTAFTRGSNVIQIAFIPGVTDRNDGLTPPVPPIPSQPQSPWSDSSGDHYFMPGDLRDSTYSGFTDDGASTIGDRRSTARSIAPSIAPSLLRESIASHAYQDDAMTNPMPAQTALRGRANVVSVRSGGNTPNVPSVSRLDSTRFPIAAASGSSTTGGPKTTTPPARSPEPLISLESPGIPTIQVSSDSTSERDDAMSVHSSAPQLKFAIEEAARRASAQPTHGGLGSVRQAASGTTHRDPSPFSDENRLPGS